MLDAAAGDAKQVGGLDLREHRSERLAGIRCVSLRSLVSALAVS
jgi:hypothetical protein